MARINFGGKEFSVSVLDRGTPITQDTKTLDITQFKAGSSCLSCVHRGGLYRAGWQFMNEEAYQPLQDIQYPPCTLNNNDRNPLGLCSEFRKRTHIVLYKSESN